MTKVIKLSDTKAVIQRSNDEALIQLIEDGFVQYSNGNVEVPPVGYLSFASPPGDVHIKYGYIKDDDYYVIKIASGFYENPKLGLNSSQGMMLVFDKKTGEPCSVLLDEGYLTDLRTALAGAVAARHLAPVNVKTIGIVGTGIQARLQLRYLKSVVNCRDVLVWGRSGEKMEEYCRDNMLSDFSIRPASSIKEIGKQCDLIITTTPSHQPLLLDTDIQSNVHITAVGADAPGKQELDSNLFSRASTIVADSTSQCVDHGELFHPIKEKKISSEQIVELGSFISRRMKRKPDSITIADLTGVAIQDIQIAKYVYLKSQQ